MLKKRRQSVQIKLRFHSLFDLWQFKSIINAKEIFVLSEDAVLSGDFSEAEIELAQRGFGADKIETISTPKNSQPG